MKIICVGRNYPQHVKELGNKKSESPVIFIKPETAILQKRYPFYLPAFSKEIHPEVEVVVKINRIGKYIEEEFAHKYYQEIGLGIDFTARDLQNSLKEKGLPWEKSKAFDGSALIGNFYNREYLPDLNNLEFKLAKNGVTVQEGNTSEMLWNIDALIAEVSRYFTLKIGDVIFTGTPAKVGPIAENDVLEGYLDAEKSLMVNIK